ncbi:MAG TPA: T9SS type A sorting domain-containing protein [Ignavibacteriales bacterium]|nr:T9SS type A sorting domain-containing protein [Ignavibacteriales bacterium]
MNKLKQLAAAALSLAFLTGWGGTGHNKINYNTTLYFPKAMSQFTSWNTILAQHASDADKRKSSDPTEGPKHYIDIENYPGFLSTGKINESPGSAISSEGILPWATITTVDSLKSAFRRKDWTKAELFAADLGHYVADGHMPLHISRDYDGRNLNSGNNASKGIHSRYETGMIDRYNSQISFTPDSAVYISDVSRFVFDYIYADNRYVDSVYAADSLARLQFSDTRSDAYFQALWAKGKNFTVSLFNNASRRLSSLIYTAWVDAGQPMLTSTSVASENEIPSSFELMQNYPNPFNPETVIRYRISTPGHVRLSVFNILGKEVAALFDGERPAGEYSLKLNAQSLHMGSGVYFYRLEEGNLLQIKKLIVLE